MSFPTHILRSKEYPKYSQHLEELPEDDKYSRFLSVMTAKSIEKYVAKIQENPEEIVIAHYNNSLNIDAAVQLSIIEMYREWVLRRIAELSISIHPESRGKWMGDELFKRALLHLKAWKKAEQVVIICSPSNQAMIKLAQRNGMKVTGNYEEKNAELSLWKTEPGIISYDLWLQLEGNHDLRIKKTVDLISKNWEAQQAVFGFIKRVWMIN